jgi:hypothetical protein
MVTARKTQSLLLRPLYPRITTILRSRLDQTRERASVKKDSRRGKRGFRSSLVSAKSILKRIRTEKTTLRKKTSTQTIVTILSSVMQLAVTKMQIDSWNF